MIRMRKDNKIAKGIFVLVTILMMSLIVSPVHAVDKPEKPKRLVLFQGFVLLAYFNDKYVEVKRLSPEHAIFYGFGWLDDHTVFTAFQHGGSAEAIADFEIVDLRKGRTTKLDGMGGVGESNFDVNTATGEIVFNDGDDLKLLKLNEKKNAYRIQEIKKGAACWAVFWIDSKTVGCKDTQNDILVKYSVTLK